MEHPLDVEAKEESYEEVIRELSEIEEKLAIKFNIPAKELRNTLLSMLRGCEVSEDDMIAKWLSLYSTATEYMENS